MTSKQIKSEIQKSLDDVLESVLQDILDYLREAKSKKLSQIELSRYLSKIIKEDRELLHRLAQ